MSQVTDQSVAPVAGADAGADPTGTAAQAADRTGAGTRPSATRRGSPNDVQGDQDPLAALVENPRLLQAARRAKFTPESLKGLDAEARSALLDEVADQLDAVSSTLAKAGRGEPPPKPAEGVQAKGGDQETVPFTLTHDPVALENSGASSEWIEERGQLVGSINGMAREMQSVREQMYVLQGDQFFRGLGPEYEELIGKGVTILDGQEPHQQFRSKVLEQASQILAGAQLRGVTMGLHEALDAALSMTTRDHTQEIARRRLEAEAAVRSGQRTGAPAGRKTEPAPGSPEAKQRSLGKIGAARRKHGLT